MVETGLTPGPCRHPFSTPPTKYESAYRVIDEVHAVGAELTVIGGVVKLVGDRSRV